MTKEEILNAMNNHYGTERWYRYSPLFPNVLLTEGARFIAESCGAYWLMDVICSHLRSVKGRFAVATLTVKNSKAKFKLVPDIPCDAQEIYAKQNITYTDFPFDEIKFYVVNDGESWVVMLPSEY